MSTFCVLLQFIAMLQVKIHFSNPIQVIENLPMGPTLRTINQKEWAIIVAECHERMQALNQNLTPATDRRFIYPGNKGKGY